MLRAREAFCDSKTTNGATGMKQGKKKQGLGVRVMGWLIGAGLLLCLNGAWAQGNSQGGSQGNPDCSGYSGCGNGPGSGP